MRNLLILPTLLTLGLAAQAEGQASLQFGLPLRCTPGQDCWIANYVDRQPGPGIRDYGCGTKTYDGHSGTDFAIRDLAVMAAGVPVIAAAGGQVKAVRDGMVDWAEPNAAKLAGRDCGNGVLLDHGGGWETQYCHLRQGSVRVRPGQPVEDGTEIGLVGLSGHTIFPHVHISVREGGEDRDPFLPSPDQTCGATSTTLWSAEVARQLPYVASEIYLAGVVEGATDAEAIRSGQLSSITVRPNAEVVTIFTDLFAPIEHDRLSLALTGPNGENLLEQSVTIERTQARRLFSLRKTRPGTFWPKGTYQARWTLSRGRGGPPQVVSLTWRVE